MSTEPSDLDFEAYGLSQLQTNVFFANRDKKLVFANDRALSTLTAVQDQIRNTFGVEVDDLVGRSIHDFHSNPAHVERLLNDPRNFPFAADIVFGDLILETNINAVHDDEGELLGYVVNWEEVGAARQAAHQAAIKHAMIENAPTNIILADKQGTIQYANPSTARSLQPLAHLLPIELNEMVGSSMDVFHQHPSHQRRLIADPSNLPHEAHIHIHDQTLSLVVSPIFDDQGGYLGPMVTWENITQKLALEEQTKSMMADAETRAAELKSKVDQLLDVVKAASKGDLTKEIPFDSEDVVGQLGQGIGAMISNLNAIVAQIIEASEQFSEGARVVAEGAQSLSDSAQSQSATTEQISGAIQNLNESIQAVADTASSAEQVADRTTGSAKRGWATVERSMEAMSLINKSAEQMGDIINVISEIAGQTNLLALNAAIEAARAGEHGLGFAVVADEVRKLAERSSTAAKEISDLIKESTQRVSEGTALSEETRNALEQIVSGIEETTTSIKQIAASSAEQASSAAGVREGAGEVAAVTENVAAAAEQMSGSSEELSGQSHSLRELVSQFKI